MDERRVRWVIGIGLAVTLATGAGCAGRGGDDEAHGGAADLAVPDESSPEAATAGDEGAAGAAGADAEVAAEDAGGPTAVELVATERDVVRTGSMRVTVEDVGVAAGEVRALAVGSGGFVADEELHVDQATAIVTVRVPTDDFDDVRDGVAELGEVTRQDAEARDVTAEVVDLESRIASQRASVERVRALLAQAADVPQLALVEGELANRETELEALLGQQRVLADQVALATLTVHLGEEDAAPPTEDATGFTGGLREGWETFTDAGRDAAEAAGFLVPFAVPMAALALALRWWVRRRPAATAASEPRP